MLSVSVSLPGIPPGAYDVRIGAGIRRFIGDALPEVCPAHRYALIADSNVAPLYAESVLVEIDRSGARGDLLTFPAGEENKSREMWSRLSDEMLQLGIGRDAAVLALGGGVTGDLVGFVAATYLRGLPLVHLPTSLLAMIDSSVGGKTGVDTPAGKNLIGAFHQPRAVIADTETLATLPANELRSGMVEAVKHGAILDEAYFAWIAEYSYPLLAAEVGVMTRLIQRSVQIKAHVVSTDEKEGGLRKTLNFGHTVGHAVEALSGFELLHGEAIAIGLVVEAAIGESLGVTAAGSQARLRLLLDRIGVPTRVPERFGSRDVLEMTRLDKKARAGKVEYALIERIGSPSAGSGSFGTPVEDDVVLRALDAVR